MKKYVVLSLICIFCMSIISAIALMLWAVGVYFFKPLFIIVVIGAISAVIANFLID